MKKNLLGVVVVALCFVAIKAKTEQVDIESSATFQSALTLTNPIPMAYGIIQFSDSAAGNIDMGTNASIIYTDGYSGGSMGAAGSVTINGTTGEIVDISCITVATLSDGTNTMPITSAEINIASGVAFGSGIACAGLGIASMAHTISATPTNNNILLGARIDGSTSPVASGAYSTANAGGSPLTIRVIYQ